MSGRGWRADLGVNGRGRVRPPPGRLFPGVVQARVFRLLGASPSLAGDLSGCGSRIDSRAILTGLRGCWLSAVRPALGPLRRPERAGPPSLDNIRDNSRRGKWREARTGAGFRGFDLSKKNPHVRAAYTVNRRVLKNGW